VESAALQQLNSLLGRWELLLSSPIWYLTVVPEIEALSYRIKDENAAVAEACKALLYDFFEVQLRKGHIALGAGVGDFDAERKTVDTVVIHHTSNPPGLRASRLSAIELIRLYAPNFAAPADRERCLRGHAIYSGHIRRGKQVFWPYHWLIRHDGRTERLLRDSEIGWHAGNWGINRRSVAIALDDDYEHRSPSPTELYAIAAIVKRHYPEVSLTRILGHREVNAQTACPSELFLGTPARRGWKSELLTMITAR